MVLGSLKRNIICTSAAVFVELFNTVKITIDPNYVIPEVDGIECGSPSLLLTEVPFDDPATQYELSYTNEVWTYWWDLDGDGVMNNAPDVIGKVPQASMSESANHSYGRTPTVKVCVNDDYVNKPIALYIFDDDMALEPSSRPPRRAVLFPFVTNHRWQLQKRTDDDGGKSATVTLNL